MKRVILSIALFAFLLGTTSCRESTMEKMEEATESAIEDTEDNLEEVGDELEEFGNEVEEDIEEERTGADDN